MGGGSMKRRKSSNVSEAAERRHVVESAIAASKRRGTWVKLLREYGPKHCRRWFAFILLLFATGCLWGCTMHLHVWGKYYGDTDNETQGIQDVHRGDSGYMLDSAGGLEPGTSDR